MPFCRLDRAGEVVSAPCVSKGFDAEPVKICSAQNLDDKKCLRGLHQYDRDAENGKRAVQVKGRYKPGNVRKTCRTP